MTVVFLTDLFRIKIFNRTHLRLIAYMILCSCHDRQQILMLSIIMLISICDSSKHCCINVCRRSYDLHDLIEKIFKDTWENAATVISD